MRRLSPSRHLLPLIGVALVAAGCADERQDVFTPEGPQAEKIDRLQVPVFIGAGAVGLLVATALAVIVLRYRRRGTDNDASLPVRVHGNTRLEAAWLVIPALILAVVAVGTLRTLFAIADVPHDALRVRVYGQ
ncbi:MAG: cytochrome c oxidase subunit II transmembrane domain-containing protein [Acidimicrobiales bacterium]